MSSSEDESMIDVLTCEKPSDNFQHQILQEQKRINLYLDSFLKQRRNNGKIRKEKLEKIDKLGKIYEIYAIFVNYQLQMLRINAQIEEDEVVLVNKKKFDDFSNAIKNSMRIGQIQKYTGFQKDVFMELLDVLPDRPREKGSKEVRVAIFLMFMKMGPSQQSLAVLTGLSQSTIYRIISKYNQDVSNLASQFISWPTFSEIREAEKKRMSAFLSEQVASDRGSRLSLFSHAWFSLIHVLPDENDVEILEMHMLTFIIDILMKKDIAIPKFFLMYNDFNVQLGKMNKENVKKIVSYITNVIKSTDSSEEENEEKQSENRTVAKFNQRWKDCVGLVIRRIEQFEKFEFNDQDVAGNESAQSIMFMWMRSAQSQDAFELLAEISTSIPFLASTIDRFCDEVISEDILVDNSKDDGIEEEKKRRFETTWKAIILTKSVDKDRQSSLWNAILTAWRISDDVEELENISNDFVKCLHVGQKILSTSVEVSKKFLGFIRTEKYRLLESQMGFALALVQCGLDRNDSLADMKKTLQKLWRAGELAEECVWMSEHVCGKLLSKVDMQLRGLVKSMENNEELRKILTEPLFVLMIALLDTPAYQKQVVIVDGRVADGCSLWILAKHILSELCGSQDNMSAQLSHLFQSIGSASNNNSALILIDVLRVVVRKWSVEILNNSKLIDGLFDYVCRMRRDIAVSLIRCLLPIINTRRQLRDSLFKSLKKDLLNDNTVCSAVPIVLMLLRSVSKRKGGGGGQFDHSLSQSFGSFSTQSLNAMGCKKNIDQDVGLELIGIVRKCLQQPVHTKIEVYNGICEMATQATTMVNQFLDMLLSHATITPEWSINDMITANKTLVQLNEPLPHLIQTIECLMGELSFSDAEFQQEGTEVLLNKAKSQIDSWVLTATRNDIDDLGLDRNIEWSTNNISGKSHFLFAQMMLSVYDVLIEHLWRKIDKDDDKEDCDKLVGLLNRRKELDAIYKEKLASRKESKTQDGEKLTPLDTSQTEVLTGAKTLASVMNKLLLNNSEDNANNTTINVRAEILTNVQMDLLYWSIQRAKRLSSSIIKEYRPLHSILSGTESLLSLSKSLYGFYLGNDTPEWMNEMEAGSVIKTVAIECYANIIQYLTVKYKSAPNKIIMSWFEEKEDEDEEARKKRQEPNVLILRHAHSLSCGLFRHVLRDENDDISTEKKANPMHEAQGKAILKATTSVLMMTKNVKVWTNLFKRAVKVLEKESFGNNQMLRDWCKFVTTCALRCGDSDKDVMQAMNSIFENLLEFLSEEAEEIEYKFIDSTTRNVAIEFFFTFVEKSLAQVREAFGFVKEFCVKPPTFDEVLEPLMHKCAEITEMVSRVLQLFVQFKLMQERITEIMTNYFSTIQMSVLLLQGQTRPWAREMIKWKSVEVLANLIKSKLTPLLSLVDDHIGFTKGKEELKKKISQKTRYQKSRRDEKLYVRFSHERESVQHMILVLCKMLKDDRFDLQIKNNSLGCREYRIDMNAIRNKVGAPISDETNTSHNSSNSSSRKRRHESDNEDSDNDDEELEEQETEMNEEQEEARCDERSERSVMNEVKREDTSQDVMERSASPVF